LAFFGILFCLICLGILLWTCYALVNNRETVSGYISSLNKFQVFLFGIIMGSVVGGVVCGLAAHWYWPTVGYENSLK